jgi:hypothetical protein
LHNIPSKQNKYVVVHLFENVLGENKTFGIFPDPRQVFIKRERENKKKIEKTGRKYVSKPDLYLL